MLSTNGALFLLAVFMTVVCLFVTFVAAAIFVAYRRERKNECAAKKQSGLNLLDESPWSPKCDQ